MKSSKMRSARNFMLAGLATTLAVCAATPQQKGFDTPQQAVDEFLKAAESDDTAALLALFGPEGKDLISTADAVRDKNYIATFLSKLQEKKAVVVDPQNASRAILVVGNADWPMPVPIVKKQAKWYFDTKAGRDEVLFRRIGANELDAIQVCRGYVEAQLEYASEARDDSGIHQYAQRLFSSPGKKDGLYWVNSDGTPGGPISEPVARAIQEGYSPNARSAFHGYFFKVLKGQGPAAPLGELDYVIKGLMIGGFALIAVPAEYGITGVKTFIVSHDGIVYEKDLGPDSLQIAKGIEQYNPDKTWRRTNDEWPESSTE